MRYVRKGSGAVIHVGETVVKASSVDRNFSLGKLCKRLGEFEDSLCLPAVPPAQPSLSAMFVPGSGTSIRKNGADIAKKAAWSGNAVLNCNGWNGKRSGRNEKQALQG